MPEETYRIERLTAERLDDMTYLHYAVYGRHLAPDFFKYKYNTAFTGVMYVGYLAYANNEPAAFYGVIPCFINGGDKLILAAQSADTMTHSNHRGKGLFVKLALLTYELCSDEGIRILFGFPNQNSQPGFVNKLNWQVSTTMERFSIPVKTIPLKSIANRLPFLRKWYNSYVNYCLKPFLSPQKGINSTVIDEGFYGLHRDVDYLNYKAAYTASFTIELNGTTVWFKIGDGMLIGDIDLAVDNMENITSRLQKLARKLGLTKINFQTDNRTVLNMLLKNYGQAIPSFPVIIKNLGSEFQLDKMAFTFADIDMF